MADKPRHTACGPSSTAARGIGPGYPPYPRFGRIASGRGERLARDASWAVRLGGQLGIMIASVDSRAADSPGRSTGNKQKQNLQNFTQHNYSIHND